MNDIEIREVKIYEQKSSSGSTCTRMVLPARWVRELGIKDIVIAKYDSKKKEIILKAKCNS